MEPAGLAVYRHRAQSGTRRIELLSRNVRSKRLQPGSGAPAKIDQSQPGGKPTSDADEGNTAWRITPSRHLRPAAGIGRRGPLSLLSKPWTTTAAVLAGRSLCVSVGNPAATAAAYAITAGTVRALRETRKYSEARNPAGNEVGTATPSVPQPTTSPLTQALTLGSYEQMTFLMIEGGGSPQGSHTG